MSEPLVAGPTTDTWRELLPIALQVIGGLKAAGYGELDFRMGGCTVLMFRFDHRIGKNIELLIYDARALNFITPRLNDRAMALVLGFEEQANTVKLIVPAGEIDFIVAAPVIPGAVAATMTVEGKVIKLDTTAEILAKTLLYRAANFRPSDVFDMAAALALDRRSSIAALRATARMRPALWRRLMAMKELTQEQLAAGILPTPTGFPYAVGMVPKLIQTLEAIQGQDNPSMPLADVP